MWREESTIEMGSEDCESELEVGVLTGSPITGGDRMTAARKVNCTNAAKICGNDRDGLRRRDGVAASVS